MPNIKFQIANQIHQLVCSEGEQQHIVNLASAVNVRVRNLSNSLGTASDSTLIAVAAITMQDEIENLKQKLQEMPNYKPNPDAKYTQNDINKAVENSLEPIVNLLEKLASKVNK